MTCHFIPMKRVLPIFALHSRISTPFRTPCRHFSTCAVSLRNAKLRLKDSSQYNYTHQSAHNISDQPDSSEDQHSETMAAIPEVPMPDATAVGGPEVIPTQPSSSAPSTKPPVKEKKGRKSKHAVAKEATKEAAISAKALRAQRTTPSAASGGIPDPTQAYLTASSLPPVTLPQPRRILIIMDLNGTLLHRPNKHRPFNFVERPHAHTFLNYCLETFHLAIWSSARPVNVNKMVSSLLTPQQVDQCLLVWARDQFGLSDEDYNSRVQCYKRLQRVWADPGVQASHPDAARGGRWDQSNTVLVDDSTEKGRTEPHNILPLPEFSGLKNEIAEVLPQVHDYLNTLSWQEDISRYIRQNPFVLDPKYKLPTS